jgi:hypothetical protein
MSHQLMRHISAFQASSKSFDKLSLINRRVFFSENFAYQIFDVELGINTHPALFCATFFVPIVS